MGQIRLIHGDCLDAMQDIPDGSVDMVMTSPPYDNLRDYGKDFNGWGPHIWKPCIDHAYRVLKDGGVCVWIVADATIKGSETGTSFKQALYAMDCGFRLHDTMIWNKGGFTATGSLSVRYASVFEYMFIFLKGSPKTFNPIKDRINKGAGGKLSGTIRTKTGKTIPISNSGKISPKYGQRFNIWQINPHRSNKERTGHPAQFPKQLATDHIISWSNEGDTILDPFMGSGTTGVACKQTGRDFIGIELDTDYFQIAETRIYDDELEF